MVSVHGSVLRYGSLVVGKAKPPGQWQAKAGGISANFRSAKDPRQISSLISDARFMTPAWFALRLRSGSSMLVEYALRRKLRRWRMRATSRLRCCSRTSVASSRPSTIPSVLGLASSFGMSPLHQARWQHSISDVVVAVVAVVAGGLLYSGFAVLFFVVFAVC